MSPPPERIQTNKPSGVAGKAGRNSDTKDCMVDAPDDAAANLRALPETRLKMYEKIKAKVAEGKAEEAIASGLAESIEHAVGGCRAKRRFVYCQSRG